MAAHSRRIRRRLLVAGLLTLLLLTACSANDEGAGSAAPEAALGHVHGLGTDPGSGTLYVASHFGVFTLTEDGAVSRVADRWQDTMAFTVVGPGHLLASGHPDLREDRPVQLGLIESRDAAETWEPVALSGEADFHTLVATDGRVWGYDAVSGRLLSTRDRKDWTTVAEGVPVVDLAPGEEAGSVLATTPDGRLLHFREGAGAPEQVPGAPPVLLVDRGEDGALVGIAADGVLHVADPDGTGWRRTGQVRGGPHAFDAGDTAWHVATADGVYRSRDEGRTWDQVLVALSG